MDASGRTAAASNAPLFGGEVIRGRTGTPRRRTGKASDPVRPRPFAPRSLAVGSRSSNAPARVLAAERRYLIYPRDDLDYAHLPARPRRGGSVGLVWASCRRSARLHG